MQRARSRLRRGLTANGWRRLRPSEGDADALVAPLLLGRVEGPVFLTEIALNCLDQALIIPVESGHVLILLLVHILVEQLSLDVMGDLILYKLTFEGGDRAIALLPPLVEYPLLEVFLLNEFDAVDVPRGEALPEEPLDPYDERRIHQIHLPQLSVLRLHQFPCER